MRLRIIHLLLMTLLAALLTIGVSLSKLNGMLQLVIVFAMFVTLGMFWVWFFVSINTRR